MSDSIRCHEKKKMSWEGEKGISGGNERFI